MSIDLLNLAVIIGRKRRSLTPHGIAHDCAELQHISNALHSLAEAECNYGLTPRQEKRRENLEATARAVAKGWRVPISFQNDPRGRPISLELGAGVSNSWGGGWRV